MQTVKKKVTIRKKKILPPDIKDLGIPNVCFSLISTKDKREKQYSKQRITRGFDDSETWSLRDTITDFIIPRFKRFREITCGYPCTFETAEEWYALLDRMIKAFELIKVMDSRGSDLTDKEYKEIDTGLKLFSKYFMHLWW